LAERQLKGTGLFGTTCVTFQINLIPFVKKPAAVVVPSLIKPAPGFENKFVTFNQV
jgi:hypothetical protein